jgi:hypothetical protein
MRLSLGSPFATAAASASARERPQRLRPGFPNDRGAMLLNGARTDAKIRGDILAALASKNPFMIWRCLRVSPATLLTALCCSASNWWIN